MSTKIYKAFKFKMSPDLKGLKHFIDEIEPKIERIYQKEFSKIFYRSYCRLHDSNQLGFSCAEMEGLKTAHGIEKRQFLIVENYLNKINEDIFSSGRRHPDYDLSFTLSFFILKDKVLIRLFTENERMEMFIRNHPLLESYYYQDSTDCPNDIDEKEWEQRSRDWSEAYQNYNRRTNQCAFSFEPLFGLLTGLPSMAMPKLIPSFFPDLASRAKLMAHEIFGREFFQSYSKQASGSNFYQAYLTERSSEKGKARIQQIANELTGKLQSLNPNELWNMLFELNPSLKEVIED